jgi:hypothetical protein
MFTNNLPTFCLQDIEKGKKTSRGYVPWTDEMDKVLLDTLVEYYKKGDRCLNGWIVGSLMCTLQL